MLKGVLCIYCKDALTKFTEEHPDVIIRMPIVTILPPDLVYWVGTVYFKREASIKSLLECLETDKYTIFAKVIQKRKRDAKLIASRKKLGETEKALYKTKSFLSGPIIIKKGIRYYPVVVEKYKQGKILEQLTKKYFGSQDISVFFKILSENAEPMFITVEDITSALTEKEKKCLIWAYELGYFEWPRIHSAVEISNHLNISRATFHERIRRAEKKIMSYIYKNLKPQGG
ncbi:helix-turn-helix domain-containing protein [Candidatus Bathyarchaeota archaeon]|nr:helix-turn-helix domain-containing protein [Candidatus Bathyarchaeota archaeon]